MIRDKQRTIALGDGRKVIVGASVDQDRGVWLLHDAPLLRWMTPNDARKLADALREAGEYLEGHAARPRARSGERRRAK